MFYYNSQNFTTICSQDMLPHLCETNAICFVQYSRGVEKDDNNSGLL